MKISNPFSLSGPPKSVLVGALITGLWLNINPAGAGEQQPAGAAETASPGSEPPASAPGQPAREGVAGMIIHLDPETGEPVEPPAAVVEELTGEHPESLSSAFSTSAAGLTEVASPAPDGGVMIHLQGRFLSPLTITRHPDGQVTIEHPEEPPVADSNE